MGKRWDYDVPSEAIWRECLRVLKPGGHLLAFAGTRTQHRMAVRIEDAGFEIRDLIAWVYGSGFPKSLDVSKALDKVNGESGRLHKFTAYMRTTGLTAKQINDTTGTFMGSHYLTDKSQPAIPTCALWSKLRPLCGEVPAWVDELVDRIEAEREVIGQDTKARSTSGASALPTVGGETVYQTWDITAPATEAARQWAGWGTALKPALEPITVARKPLIGTVAENVLAHGTGALNVDGCRVKLAADEDATALQARSGGVRGFANEYVGGKAKGAPPTDMRAGRWPANLIHDGSEDVVGLFPVTGASKAAPRGGTNPNPMDWGNGRTDGDIVKGHTDNGGSAARFFYCAKASKRDRDEGLKGFEEKPTVSNMCSGSVQQSGEGERLDGNPLPKRANNHPTVKPTDLMRYLCRLVTPPGGTVLDPFMGSGSTGKAAMLEGFDFIGIERDPEYVKIAEARIGAARRLL
jgi:DNA modification methylase